MDFLKRRELFVAFNPERAATFLRRSASGPTVDRSHIDRIGVSYIIRIQTYFSSPRGDGHGPAIGRQYLGESLDVRHFCC